MGQHNAWAVTLNWAHLPANPFKVLIKMALFLPDDHEKPRWFAGDQMLLEAIGKAVPPWDDSPEAWRARHTGDVLLRRALKQLIAEGALEYRIRPVKGTRPEYWCHWVPQQTVAEYATDSCGMDNKLLQEPQQTVVPKEKRGEGKKRQENWSPEVTISPAAVDNTPPKINPPPGACPHGNPAGRLGGPGTEPTCPDCRRTTRAAR